MVDAHVGRGPLPRPRRRSVSAARKRCQTSPGSRCLRNIEAPAAAPPSIRPVRSRASKRVIGRPSRGPRRPIPPRSGRTSRRDVPREPGDQPQRRGGDVRQRRVESMGGHRRRVSASGRSVMTLRIRAPYSAEAYPGPRGDSGSRFMPRTHEWSSDARSGIPVQSRDARTAAWTDRPVPDTPPRNTSGPGLGPGQPPTRCSRLRSGRPRAPDLPARSVRRLPSHRAGIGKPALPRGECRLAVVRSTSWASRRRPMPKPRHRCGRSVRRSRPQRRTGSRRRRRRRHRWTRRR